MNSFLKLVAEDLYNKLGNDLSRVAVVFPNKRASLFFNEHLAAQTQKPIWSPAYVSISDLFQRLSPLKIGDPISLVCILYKIFREETRSEETLDDFYFWGELLISDFDDVDKNLVDADRLFTNLQELNGIMDDLDFIDEEQEAAIQQFFQNFSIEKRTILKERFISLWDCLGDIYKRFKHELHSKGIAYEGMLYREVIESLSSGELPYDKFVFVGFNVLNKVEHSFFYELKKQDKALFYWDYDLFYTRPIHKVDNETTRNSFHEAGEFIVRNLKDFGNELPSKYFDELRKPKSIRYLASPTENAQSRYIPQWLDSLEQPYEEKENAVVLCNEALLLPTLHTIPDSVKNVNITMGFPLSQTPVFSFINAVVELQINGYRKQTGRYIYQYTQAALKHPYTMQCSPHAIAIEKELTQKNRFYPLPGELQKDDFLRLLFAPVDSLQSLCQYLTLLLKEISKLYRQEKESDDIFNQLYRESLFKGYTIINRLSTLIEEGQLDVRIDTFRRLLNRILTTSNIPFHGEPAIGMQVMGVLETRNLDFKNLMILSLNEGQLPQSGGESSFIPYNLRKAFGMTTIEHKIAVYAYYFYRLIQRAENITLAYNTSSEGLNRGEMSRFMLQFLIEWPNTIKREYLEAEQAPQAKRDIIIDKSQSICTKMQNRYNIKQNAKATILSPSALNTYLDCSLRFYFRYIAGITIPNEVSAEIDSALFGTIFHRSAELIYESLTVNRKLIRKEDIEELLKNDYKLQLFIDQAFKEEFFKMPLNEHAEYNGLQLINSKVIESYLKQLLKIDLQYAPFEMHAMEEKKDEIVMVNDNINVRIGGTIDRIDIKDNIMRIVDYKTGGTPKSPNNMDELFTPSDKRPNYIFQTFLYSSIMCHNEKYNIAPSLLYIHKTSNESYTPIIEMGEARKPKIPITNFSEYDDDFRAHLCQLLNEIFDPTVSFKQTEQESKCSYCDYKSLCKR